MADESIVSACYTLAASIMDSSITSATNFEAQMKFHIVNAISSVKRYCCLDTIAEDYYNAVTNLAIVYFNNQKALINNDKSDRLASKSQGSRSESYRDTTVSVSSGGIPDYIKAMLPTPKIKVVG